MLGSYVRAGRGWHGLEGSTSPHRSPGTCWPAGQQHQGVLAGRYAAGVVPQSRMNRRKVPIVVAVNGLLMAGAWFLLPRGWLFTLQSALAFPVVLSS